MSHLPKITTEAMRHITTFSAPISLSESELILKTKILLKQLN